MWASEISDEGLVVIPQSGTYIIFVDLGSKTISIQKPVIYGYGTAAGRKQRKDLCLLRKVATGKHSLLLYLMEDVSEYILIILLLIILILHLVLGNANMLLIRRLLKSILRKEGMMNRTKIMYGLPTL